MKFACCIALLFACASPCFADQSVGVTSLGVAATDNGRPLTLSIWYPAEGGTAEKVGGNAVFLGVSAGRDAPIGDGRFPLALVSHGGLRSATDSGAWLSGALAQAGYIAVEVNSPRPGSAKEAVNEIWQRPNDMTRALNTILSNSNWAGSIDPTRVSIVGFALGGTAALALAGGAFEPAPFLQSCNTALGPDCDWYKAQNVSLDTVDQQQLAMLRQDPRITSVAAIDPEYVDVFADRLASVNTPTLIVSLGDEDKLGQEDLSPNLGKSAIPGANMFDGFATCTAAGPAILSNDGGNPDLCGSSAEARERVHRTIAGQIISFLNDEKQQ
ncbi:MAG: hypothetical protein ABJN26_14280 [Stappiaceae bacterium]